MTQDDELQIYGEEMNCIITGEVQNEEYALAEFSGTCNGQAFFAFGGEEIVIDSDCEEWDVELAQTTGFTWISTEVETFTNHTEIAFQESAVGDEYLIVS